MSLLLSILLAAQGAAAPVPVPTNLPPGTPIGPETTISFAGNGALRQWTPGPTRGILYVRDRTERWYQVTLTGPCRSLYRNLDTLSYTTDPNGTFDRFSRLRLTSVPTQACGVKGIRESTAPKDFPQTRPHRG